MNQIKVHNRVNIFAPAGAITKGFVMPQYELMFIVSSSVPDNEESGLAETFTQLIASLGGEILSVENLGKKKLAYPIKGVRNATYILVNFKLDTDKVREVDEKIRMTAGVIRHLILNMDETLIRQAKDLEEQKMIKRRMPVASKEGPAEGKPEIHIDLDKQIEKAMEEDLTK
jgi:small subunit ribosomal protein S6